MNISVCCPSYRRHEVQTLNYLPFCRVYVDRKEAEAYREKNPGAEIVECPGGVQGNVARIRNYILDQEFSRGADACCLVDDDMKSMQHFELQDGYGYQNMDLATADFMAFLEKHTMLCAEWGLYLWGVNCNFDNLGYRHSTPFSTLSFIGGPFCVHLNNPIRYDELFLLKEDYDLFLEHCRQNRGALRVNKYHYIVKQAENVGGCASYRTNEKEKAQFALLQQKWGAKIIRADRQSKRAFDFNPLVYVPIKGI